MTGAQHRPPKSSSAQAAELRKELLKIHRWLSSPQKIIDLAELCKVPLGVEEAALGKFMNGTTAEPGEDTQAALRTFFDLPIARLLRNPSFRGAPGTEMLLTALTSGVASQGQDVDLQGLYFAYHGSHLERKHFVVRAIRIINAGKALISLDMMDDRKGASRKIHEAPGLVSVFDGRPHLVALGEDNAVGFRVIVMFDFNKQYASGSGQMFGMTNRNLYFSRAIYLRREHKLSKLAKDTDRLFAEMVAQTGIRTLDQVPENHRAVFVNLAEAIKGQEFADPILDLVPEDRKATIIP